MSQLRTHKKAENRKLDAPLLAKPLRAGLPEPRRQAAALVFRTSGQCGLEILLVNSRGTGRAVMPKGWLIAGEQGYQAAAREAYEEAGIQGKIDRTPIGNYEYRKKRADQDELVPVEVYPLKISRQRKKWPEQGCRKLRWLPPAEAANLVDEPMLAALIRWFTPANDQMMAEREVSLLTQGVRK